MVLSCLDSSQPTVLGSVVHRCQGRQARNMEMSFTSKRADVTDDSGEVTRRGENPMGGRALRFATN